MKFLIDGMLIKLARYLRFLGFDTEIVTHVSRDTVAAFPDRILVTRSPGHYALWPFPQKYLIQSRTFEDQLQELNRVFNLQDRIQWLTRCSRCNSLLKPVAREQVQFQLPEQVAKNFEHFYQCPQCGKIYWEGGHVVRLTRKLQRLGIEVQNRKGEAND